MTDPWGTLDSTFTYSVDVVVRTPKDVVRTTRTRTDATVLNMHMLKVNADVWRPYNCVLASNAVGSQKGYREIAMVAEETRYESEERRKDV